uniref:Tyrosine specific protein phosphatases domain-containing protein n=2 Tax=Arion vulgaris TaxID=1028688 RepID=A0A0B7BC14_9EUPU
MIFASVIRRTFSFGKRAMPPPHRWEDYSPMGSIVPGTKFIAFKVPLKEELLKPVEEKDRFSPAILMKLLNEQGLKLGGVIDLTFTYKYYNGEEFLKNSVGYKKVFTPGHVVPDQSVFQEFAHAVKSFDDDRIIGVHCTHGVNRTGYLICRYMIEEMDYEPDVAISLFHEARGHKIEREIYLEDLRLRKRGQSSYDPNFKVQDVQHPNTSRDKPRWRHHRADHPDWRRNYHDSSQDKEARFVSESSKPSPHATEDICQGESPPKRRRNDQFMDRNHALDISAQGSSDHYSRDNRYSHDRPAYGNSRPHWGNRGNFVNRSAPGRSDCNWRDRQDSAPTNFNPNWSSYGHNRGYHNDYEGSRFNPKYSYRNPVIDRDRKDGYRPRDNKFD